MPAQILSWCHVDGERARFAKTGLSQPAAIARQNWRVRFNCCRFDLHEDQRLRPASGIRVVTGRQHNEMNTFFAKGHEFCI